MADAHDVLERFNEEVFGQGNVELIDELVHEDYVDHGGIQGDMDRDGLKDFVQAVHAALSDTEATLERAVVDGNQIAWRWSMRGKHTGEFMGIPASGNVIEVTGNDIGVMRDGKIAEAWGELDTMDLMTQLGAIEPPTG